MFEANGKSDTEIVSAAVLWRDHFPGLDENESEHISLDPGIEKG